MRTVFPFFLEFKPATAVQVHKSFCLRSVHTHTTQFHTAVSAVFRFFVKPSGSLLLSGRRTGYLPVTAVRGKQTAPVSGDVFRYAPLLTFFQTFYSHTGIDLGIASGCQYCIFEHVRFDIYFQLLLLILLFVHHVKDRFSFQRKWRITDSNR